jgi:hypothetical protein
LGNVKTVAWLHVSVAMAITAIKIALGLHVNQDLQCSILENAGEIVWLIKLGWVRITVADVIVGYSGFRLNKDVLDVMTVVRSV